MFRFDGISRRQKENKEVTMEEMDAVTVIAHPDTSNEEILSMVMEGEEVGFILTKHNIFLAKSSGEDSLKRLWIKKEDSLIPNGVLEDEGFSKTLKFAYSLEGDANKYITKEAYIKKIAESKIIAFLRSHGIEIEKIAPL